MTYRPFDVSLLFQIKEPLQDRPDLSDHIIRNMVEFSDYCRARDSHKTVQLMVELIFSP